MGNKYFVTFAMGEGENAKKHYVVWLLLFMVYVDS